MRAHDGPVLAAQAEQRDEKRLDTCDLGSAALSVAAVLGAMLSSDRRFDKQKNAMAIFSKAHGKGLESAIARKLAKFTIEARDAEGARMQHGGDTFTVTIHGASVVRARVQDNEDGTYSVEYKAAASGAYSISVLLYGLALPESPWSLNVLTARPDAEQCHLHGAALTRAAARETMSFEVSFADAHGNPTHAEV